MSNPLKSTSVEDEESLLAAIGTTLKDSSTYETQVLQDATRSHAPQLTGSGFPDLAQLAPSYSALTANHENKKASAPLGDTDVPHMLKVLSNITIQLDNVPASSAEKRQTQILRMKRQILLTYLATYTNLSKDEVGINITKEARDEEWRREKLIRTGREGKIHEQKLLSSHNDDVQSSNLNPSRNKRSGLYFSRRAAQRLENIKNGEMAQDDEVDVLSKSATASFGSQALSARNESIEHSKRRRSAKKMSMMNMKKKLVEDEGGIWVDPQELWKRRLARIERRKRRREHMPSGRKIVKEETCDEINSLAAVQSKSAGEDSNMIDLTVDDSSGPDESSGHIVLTAKAEIEKTDDSNHIQNKRRHVHCNICKENLEFQQNEDPDSFLAQHMQDCQSAAKKNTSSNRRSSRKRTKPLSYKDDEDLDLYKKMSNKQRRRAVKGYVDDEDVGDAESSEDEILVQDKDEVVIEPSSRLDNQYIQSRNEAIDDYEVDDYEDRVDDWIENGIQRMSDMAEQDEQDERPGAVIFPGGLEIPSWINDKLFGYQRTALRWLWELHLQGSGGIVGDEMGLGKTVQVCSYLGAMASSRKLRSILIIAPATILAHWLSELGKWSPGLRRILMHKSGERGRESNSRSVSRRLLSNLDKWLGHARADRIYEAIDDNDLLENGANSFCGTGYVVLTTFENIRRATDIWIGHKWDYVVMDEGQKIRNPDAEVTIACKRLRTPHRLLLSGTPIQNDLRELWSLFDFIFPGRLGTLPVFMAEFADPIKRGGYSNATPMQVQLSYRCALVLRELINPFLLRRQKKDMKEVTRMPGKTEQVLFCNLSRRQRSMYESYLKSDDVTNIIRGSAQCFKPIIMLRKICNHPDLICSPHDGEYESFLKNGFVDENDLDESSDEEELGIDNCDDSTLVDRSGKLEVLAKILPLWKKQGHRVLIFSQWKKMLDIIQHFMNIQGYKIGRLDGNTNVASRQRLVDTFNTDDSYFAMLLTTKTGGVGLNLTGANKVILYDPDWNPASDAQARERAWRFGQKNSVTVYRLITAGTIEEKIYQRQIFKTALTNSVLQDPRQRRMFSQKDLRNLFTLAADVDSVGKGGEGITETGELTRGRGVVDADEGAVDIDSSDNKETMKEVLKSKGLAGIFDHDIVDKPYAKKSSSLREMENEASKVASRAAQSLLESTTETERASFVPTWTGSTQAETGRFGGVSKKKKIFTSSNILGNMNGCDSQPFDSSFGGADSAGLGIMNATPLNSRDLLNQVQQRRKEIESGGMSTGKIYNNEDTFALDLMKRIRNYIKRFVAKSDGGPTTAQILSEFKDVKNTDAVLFKKILKQVAFVRDGHWEVR